MRAIGPAVRIESKAAVGRPSVSGLSPDSEHHGAEIINAPVAGPISRNTRGLPESGQSGGPVMAAAVTKQSREIPCDALSGWGMLVVNLSILVIGIGLIISGNAILPGDRKSTRLNSSH